MLRNPHRFLTLLTALAATTVVGACDDDDGDNGTPPPSAPSAPSNVSATADGTSVTVTWSAVANADSYTATLRGSGGASDVTESGVTTTTVTFTDLVPGATYFPVVTASNSAGTSGEASGSAVEIAEEPSNIVEVSGDILSDETWTSDRTYVLTQPIFVGVDCGTDGNDPNCVEATLTIEPGTTILGRRDVPQGVRASLLVVSRGSRIIADATGGEDRAPTADEVIVFTSDQPAGQRAREDWGGIVINGQAPTNVGEQATGEGDSGLYGGPDVNDDSGILRGVRIEYAGDDVTPGDQLNGLALQGVGAGTTISYVQIHYNLDDGIEPFGGTVSVDHLVVSGIGDDSVDGTDGYRGFMQFIVGQQRGDDADQGLEISTSGEVGNESPQSTAVIANATMIGGNADRVDGGIGGAESDDAVQFREGSNYRVFNSIFTGFGEAGLCIVDGQTIANAQNRLDGSDDPATTLRFEGNILWNNGGDDVEAEFSGCEDDDTAVSEADLARTFFETEAFNNLYADPMLPAGAFDIGSQESPPDVIPTAMPEGYEAADLSGIAFDDFLIEPLDGRTLVDTDYAGAVEPGTALADAWYAGWTIWSEDGSDSRPLPEGF